MANKKKFVILFILFMSVVFACTAWAAEGVINLEHPLNDDFYAADRKVNVDDFYATGRTVNVSESIGGDLMATAESISSTGTIEGDILAAGRSIDIKGSIGGDVRTAGQIINLDADINRAVTVFGQRINIAKETSIGKNVILGGKQLELAGDIEGNVRTWGETTSVSANIGGDLIVEANKLKLLPGAVVNGNIQYKGPNQPEISEEAEVKGEINYTQARVEEEPGTQQVIWNKFLSLFKLLGLALLLALLAAPFLRAELEIFRNKPWLSLGTGFSWLLLGPVLIFLLAVIIIGQKVAWIFSVSYVGFFITALFLFKPLAGTILGKWVLDKWGGSREYSLVWAVLLGTTLLWIVGLIPVVGFLVTAVGTVFILGSWLVLIARYGLSLPNRNKNS